MEQEEEPRPVYAEFDEQFFGAGAAVGAHSIAKATSTRSDGLKD